MPALKRTFGPDGEVRELTPYTAEKEQFIEWLATPKHLREPSTMKGMAEALGVHLQTLYNWRRDPRVVEAVRGKLQSVLSISELPDIIESLLAQAKDPENTRSVQASKLLVDMMEKAELKTAATPLADMSNEEIRLLAAELHDEVDDRIQDKSA